jgi:hypothetical protein
MNELQAIAVLAKHTKRMDDEEDQAITVLSKVLKERDEYALLIFQPCGAEHHNSNRCPYCKENLNGKGT